MTKRELITALTQLPVADDAVVVLDVLGRMTTDYRPEVRIVGENVRVDGVDDDVQPQPGEGELIILL